MSPSPDSAPGCASSHPEIEPRLHVRSMSLRRAGRTVLEHVDLDVRRSEIVCISGPSGCGKTALLRALARLEPASGTLQLQGANASSIPYADYRRRVSLVFQESPMFEGTVADNVRYGPFLRGETLDGDAVRRLLQSFALDPRMATRDAEALSGGERQRVALARAMANRPDVLLLDEPTSALDPEATQEVLSQVARIALQGVSIIAVLHVREQANSLSQSGYRLAGGRLHREPA